MNFAYKQALLIKYYLRMLSLIKQLADPCLLPDKVNVAMISVECLDILWSVFHICLTCKAVV